MSHCKLVLLSSPGFQLICVVFNADGHCLPRWQRLAFSISQWWPGMTAPCASSAPSASSSGSPQMNPGQFIYACSNINQVDIYLQPLWLVHWFVLKITFIGVLLSSYQFWNCILYDCSFAWFISFTEKNCLWLYQLGNYGFAEVFVAIIFFY